jgi:hypothetical protein
MRNDLCRGGGLLSFLEGCWGLNFGPYSFFLSFILFVAIIFHEFLIVFIMRNRRSSFFYRILRERTFEGVAPLEFPEVL